MTQLAHEKVVVTRGQRSQLPIIVAVHSTKFGPAAGGCRLSNYDDWRDGLEDALRLSEAMTLKCAIAGLPNGGGKSVIALPTGRTLDPSGRRDVMLDLGDVIDSLGGSYLAGEDVGTTADDMAIARERTEFAYCLPADQGGSGEPSEPTAVGVRSSLEATCAHVFGDASPAGRRFTIIGLGQVGGRLARRLAEDGAILYVTDIDESKKELADEIGATWLSLDEAVAHDTDVLVPAALGGILTAQSVETLRCRAVCGPANNQLADPTVAELLAKKQIVWAPDFVVNGGGVLYSSLVELGGFSPEAALERVDAIGSTLREIFAVSDREDVTPYQAAETLAYSRLQGV